MPRSAAKSQADKGGRRSSVQVTTPRTQDLEVEDIIPGRLTQVQWTDMLIQEDTEDVVGEIMAELLSQVMEGCFKAYIKRQLAPFSTSWAKSYLIHILEWQFLCQDEGEGPEEASKTEDSEPLPATPDVWAQGCFPVLYPTPSSKPTSQQQETDIGQVPAKTEPRTNQPCNVMAQTNSSLKQSDKEKSPRKPASDRRCKVLSPHSPPQINRKKKQQDHSPPKLVTSKFLPPLPCSPEKMDTEAEGESRSQSVYNQMTGSLYRHKDHQSIPKLDHSCPPRHCIIPQYEILDNNTKPNSKKPHRLSKLEPRYNKQQSKWTVWSSEPLTDHKDQPAKKRNEADVLLRKSFPSTRTREVIMSSGLLRLDTMDLAKGVSLLDPQSAEINSLTFKPQAQSAKLRPIQSDATLPLFSVDQFTTAPPPQVTPLFRS